MKNNLGLLVTASFIFVGCASNTPYQSYSSPIINQPQKQYSSKCDPEAQAYLDRWDKVKNHANSCKSSSATSKACDNYSEQFGRMQKISDLLDQCQRNNGESKHYFRILTELQPMALEDYRAYANRLEDSYRSEMLKRL